MTQDERTWSARDRRGIGRRLVLSLHRSVMCYKALEGEEWKFSFSLHSSRRVFLLLRRVVSDFLFPHNSGFCPTSVLPDEDTELTDPDSPVTDPEYETGLRWSPSRVRCTGTQNPRTHDAQGVPLSFPWPKGQSPVPVTCPTLATRVPSVTRDRVNKWNLVSATREGDLCVVGRP